MMTKMVRKVLLLLLLLILNVRAGRQGVKGRRVGAKGRHSGWIIELSCLVLLKIAVVPRESLLLRWQPIRPTTMRITVETSFPTIISLIVVIKTAAHFVSRRRRYSHPRVGRRLW